MTPPHRRNLRSRVVVAAALAAALLGTLLPVGAPGATAQSGGGIAGSAASASATGSAVVVAPTPARTLGVPSRVSVALVEATTGQVLVAQDADVRRPVASAIKLLTALVVVDALPEGSLVTVGEEVRGIEGSSYGLRPGDRRTVEDLLVGLLLRSGNDVAVALAAAVAGGEAAFVDLMSARLAALGIEARPASASGLEEEDALSAVELATVARAALAEPRIRDVVGRTVVTLPNGLEVENRNAYLLDDPSATGLKTGFTNAAGFTLAASAERDGRTLLAVVLGAADDTERRGITRRLLDHGYDATAPFRVETSLGLRTVAGPVELRVDLGSLTVPIDRPVRIAWPEGVRPSDATVTASVVVGEAPVGEVLAERSDARVDAAGATPLGRALADGVYAALRPGAIAALAGPAGTTGR